MRSNSNRPEPPHPTTIYEQSSTGALLRWAQFVTESHLNIKHFYFLNGSISMVNSAVEEPDVLQIREVESEEQVNSIVQDGSFERFTEDEDGERFTDEELEQEKPEKQTEESNFDSLRQTAHFSSEGDKEQEAEMVRIDMAKLSAKQRLLNKLLMEKSRITNQTHNNSKENSSIHNISKDNREVQCQQMSTRASEKRFQKGASEPDVSLQRPHKSIFTQTAKRVGAPPLNRTFKFR